MGDGNHVVCTGSRPASEGFYVVSSGLYGIGRSNNGHTATCGLYRRYAYLFCCNGTFGQFGTDRWLFGCLFDIVVTLVQGITLRREEKVDCSCSDCSSIILRIILV